MVAVYLRNVLFSPLNAIPSRHLASDLWGDIYFAYEKLTVMRGGFIPLVGWWVPRGGGYPSVLVDTLLSPSQSALIALYAVLGNWFLALKVLIVMCWVLLAFTSYLYGRKVFDGWDRGLIFAVAFTFTAFMGSQLEHLNILFTVWVIPLALIAWENLAVKGGKKWFLLSVVTVFYVFLSDWYSLMFLMFFLAVRMVYLRFTLKATLKTPFLAFISVFMLALPIFLNDGAAICYRARPLWEAMMYTSDPNFLWLRFKLPPWTGEFTYLYMGLSVSFLAWIAPPIPDRKFSREASFMMLVALLALLYGSCHYAPFNFHALVTKFFPFTSFIRVPTRAFFWLYFAFAFCSVIGYRILREYFAKPKKLKKFLPFIVATIIFLDLTVGFEPSTVQPPINSCEAYNWIANQEGFFRIVEIPSAHDWNCLVSLHAKHETLNHVVWMYQMFPPTVGFAKLYWDFVAPEIYTLLYGNYTELQPVNTSNLAEESAMLGVKYVLIRFDKDFHEKYFNGEERLFGFPPWERTVQITENLKKSGDWRLVYRDKDFLIFENLRFKGYAYIVKGEGKILGVEKPNPNTVNLVVETSKGCTVALCENWFPTWRSNNAMFKVTRHSQFLAVEIPRGGLYAVKLQYVQPSNIYFERWKS